MTKRTPATDVTLSPSLAEILLELVDPYIILLLQAKHREVPLLRAFSCESANSDKRAVHRKPCGTKPVPKRLFTGTAAVIHEYSSAISCFLRGPCTVWLFLVSRDLLVLQTTRFLVLQTTRSLVLQTTRSLVLETTRLLGLRFSRIFAGKLFQQFRGVFEILCRFPARTDVVVAGPLHQIRQFPVPLA
jgi:hypothetical protein